MNNIALREVKFLERGAEDSEIMWRRQKRISWKERALQMTNWNNLLSLVRRFLRLKFDV